MRYGAKVVVYKGRIKVWKKPIQTNWKFAPGSFMPYDDGEGTVDGTVKSFGELINGMPSPLATFALGIQ